MDIQVTITGLEECCENLANAPKEAIPNALLAGLTAGAKVIETAVAARTPSGTISSEGETSLITLREDLDTNVTLDSEFRGGVAEIGFSEPKAGWVEWGHHMLGHKPTKKDLGTVQPHPFMRPAADVAEEPAVEAFVEAVNGELERVGLLDAA